MEHSKAKYNRRQALTMLSLGGAAVATAASVTLPVNASTDKQSVSNKQTEGCYQETAHIQAYYRSLS